MHKKFFAVFAAIVSLVLISGSAPAALLADSQQTKDIVFGAPQTYNHKSGWFTLATPANWNLSDKSAEGEVIVAIIDPTGNGVVVVRVHAPSKGYTQAQLGERLKSFLTESLKDFDGFSMGDLKSQRDGRLGLYFKYNSIIEGVSHKMQGDAFVEQHNGLIGVLTLIMPQDQYEAKQKEAYAIVNSFRVTGSAP